MLLPQWPKAAKKKVGKRASDSLPIVTIASLLVCLFVQIALWPQLIASKGGLERYVRETTDFSPTLTAARILRLGKGAELYNRATQQAVQQTIVAPFGTLHGNYLNIYNHPPLEALLVAPLIDLPYGVVFWIWALLSCVAFIVALALLRVALPLPRRALQLATLAAISFHPLHLSLWLGQNTALVVLGFAGILVGIRRRNEQIIGVSLLLVALKPQLLLPLVGFLLVGRYIRALGLAVVLAGIAAVAAMPILGWRWPIAYLRFLAIDSNLGAAVAEKPYIMPNWRGLAVNLFGPDASPQISAVTLLLTIVTIGLFFWTAHRLDGQAIPFWRTSASGWRKDDTLLFYALTCILALLIAPHLNPHDLAVLIVPGWILVHELVKFGKHRRYTVLGPYLLAGGYVLPLITLYVTSDYRLPVITLVLYMTIASIFLLVLISSRAAQVHCAGPLIAKNIAEPGL